MDTKAIGMRISLFRSQINMTQAELAKQLGCTPQHISAIERGVKTPKLDTFVAIANVLHVRPNLLLQDVLDDWKENEETNLDYFLAVAPPDTRYHLKREILVEQQVTKELEGTKNG